MSVTSPKDAIKRSETARKIKKRVEEEYEKFVTHKTDNYNSMLVKSLASKLESAMKVGKTLVYENGNYSVSAEIRVRRGHGHFMHSTEQLVIYKHRIKGELEKIYFPKGWEEVIIDTKILSNADGLKYDDQGRYILSIEATLRGNVKGGGWRSDGLELARILCGGGGLPQF
jgi:hypothetical protein